LENIDSASDLQCYVKYGIIIYIYGQASYLKWYKN